MFDEFFPNVYSQLHAHSFLIHNIVDAVVLFLRKYHKTHCHLRLKFPTFTHDRNDLELMEFHKRHIHLKKRKKALNFERGGSSKLSKADEVIPGPPFMATSCHMIRTADQWNQTHVSSGSRPAKLWRHSLLWNFFQPQCFILSSEKSKRISECLGGGIFHDVRSCRCTDPVKKVISFFFFFF